MDNPPNSRRDGVIEALSTLQTIDPLYRPAEFLLGYAYFRRGNANDAICVFEQSVERFEADMKYTIDQLAKEWLIPLRWMGLGKHFAFVRHFNDVFEDSLIALHGGNFVRGTEAWDELKFELGRAADTISSRDFYEAHISALVDNLSKNLPDCPWPAIAAGRTKSDGISQRGAYIALDAVVGPGKIQELDMNLNTLWMECLIQNLNTTLGVPMTPSELIPDASEFIANLLQNSNAARMYFEPHLNDVKLRINERKWEDAGEIVLRLRKMTRSRSQFEFASMLTKPETETWNAWMASLFVPAIGKVRERRKQLREPLYVETVYYLAYSYLIRFDVDGLKMAQERAKKLREERLAPNQSLSLLTACLEVEAYVQLLEQDKHASSGILSPILEWTQKIEKATKMVAQEGEVRAAAYAALGMIQRYERLRQAERERRPPFRFDSSSKERYLYQETAHYRKALECKESATTHCYMAQSLIEQERKENAAQHVRRALLIAPDHVLAKRLADQMPH
jgi:tetratricopeptide (TPR) repeat protein